MKKSLILKPGRDKSVRQKHPWIFSGAVAQVLGDPGSGETVLVQDADGKELGWAAFSPHSKILARMWTWNVQETISFDFFQQRIRASIAARKAVLTEADGNAMRLVHAESDGLPGVVVDQYGKWLVAQFLTAGAELWRDTLTEALLIETGLDQIYERSDVEVRRLEGLPERSGALRGSPPERVEIVENGIRYWVDIVHGQKTGFYLDQRANRQRLRTLANGRSVLNCFCYTGGFSLSAIAGGALEVLSIDSSAEALQMARENTNLNQLCSARVEWLEGDVFYALRKLRDQGRSFDVVVLDPPKFAPTAAQAEKAARGYKDINLLGFKLLNPGGLLFTFSCSGGISADLFQKIIAGAALDAGVDARMIEHFEQGPDHPTALSFPEGAYLKGLLCQKL